MADNHLEDNQIEPTPTEPVPNEPISPAPLEADIEDPVTEEAVKDIAVSESDQVLATDDAAIAPPPTKSDTGWKAKLKKLFKNKWTWIGLAVLLVILLGVPQTRYKILGLAWKKTVNITVVDSKSNRPVSAAGVRLGGAVGKTDGSGHVRLRTGVGPHTITVQKHYYKQARVQYFVGLKSAKPKTIKFTATGRLVPVIVINKLTGQPLKGAEIKVLNTSAKTDAKGQATIALPANHDTEKARLSLGGYNPLATPILITDQANKANTFKLVPAGHVYFLSNLSGTIDVVRSDLDGGNRKTVFKGTGREDPRTTNLLAARDWRYAVLKANREGSQAALYIIDGSNDKVTQFDSSLGDFDLIGWYNHNFLYDLTRDSVPSWQAGRQQLKSYDADHGQPNQLDQTQAEGTPDSYAYQNFYNFYIVNGAVVYNTQWYTFNASGGAYDTGGKTDAIRAIQLSGQSKKDYQTWPANTNGSVQAVLYGPNAVYYAVYGNNTGKTSYYAYENQAVSTASIDAGAFNRDYPTYLVSPSGNHTFWTELRDGKNSLFVGDANAGSKRQIGSSGDYAPYGWFSDDYLLVSKNNSELYIMSSKGLNSHKPFKITDYYKPPVTYPGYGYGYGGL